MIIEKIRHWLNRRLPTTEQIARAASSRRSPDHCPHTEWTSPYDYDTYPGAVRIVESYCKECGTQARGSCQ